MTFSASEFKVFAIIQGIVPAVIVSEVADGLVDRNRAYRRLIGGTVGEELLVRWNKGIPLSLIHI